jgi:uncharacterized membrane protein
MNGMDRFEPTQAPRFKPWPRFALSLATLAAAGYSLILLARGLLLERPARLDFITKNTLAADRKQLLLFLLAGSLLTVLAAALLSLRGRSRATATINRIAALTGPAVLAGMIPALFIWEFGQRQTLHYLVLLALFVLSLKPLLEISIRAIRQLLPRRAAGSDTPLTPGGSPGGSSGQAVATPDDLSRPWLSAALRMARRLVPGPSTFCLLVVFVASAAYACYTSYFTVLRHRLIHTTAFDLGIYDNLMYNAIKGDFFRSPVLFGPGNQSYLAGHAEYAMVLFAPIYALRPHAETLLILQCVLLGFAAVPLYLFSATRLRPPTALLLALGYLLFAPLHGPNFYDFHWLPLSIFFYFWLFYGLAVRKNWIAVPMVLILLAIREDIAVGMSVLGLFLFFTGERTRMGMVLAVLSALWFCANRFYIMPAAGTWWFENMYAELFADGNNSYASIVKTLLSNPVYSTTTLMRETKLVYALHMLVPLAFLPVRRLALVPLLLPGAAFTLLTTGYTPTLSISFQYTSHWIPFLFLTSAISLWLMDYEPDGRARRAAYLATFCLVLLSHSYNFGAILPREHCVGGFGSISVEVNEAQKRRYLDLMSLVERIPRRASVAATEYMIPHISARKNAYTFRYDFGRVDYILISSRELHGNVRKRLEEVFKRDRWGLAGASGGEFYLFERDGDTKGMDAALRRLAINPRIRKR